MFSVFISFDMGVNSVVARGDCNVGEGDMIIVSGTSVS